MRLGRSAFALCCVGLVSAKQTIWITSIQPYTGGVWDGGISVSEGAKIMLEQVNKHNSLLRDYELKIVWQDGWCSTDKGTSIFHSNLFEKRYFPFVPNASYGLGDLDMDGDGIIETEETVALSEEWDQTQVSPEPIGILGPGCSNTIFSIFKDAHHMNYPMVSNMATRPALSDRTEYPNFFRTIMPDTLFAAAWVGIAKILGQSSMVTVIAETQNWESMGERMALEAEAAGISLVGEDLSAEIPGLRGLQVSVDSVTAAKKAATLLVQYKQRIVVLILFEMRTRLILCEAYKLGLRNAVFLTFGWHTTGWWSVPDTSCSPEQITLMARGFIGAQTRHWRNDGDARLSCSESMTAREFQEEWFRRLGADFGDYSMRPEGYTLQAEAASTADALCMYAQALDALLVGRGFPFDELIARTDRAYAELMEVFQATDFEGVQGQVSFLPGSGDMDGTVKLQQLQVAEGGTAKLVSIAAFKNGTFEFLGEGDLIFGLPGEQVFAGPAGAAEISMDFASYTICRNEQTLDMELNRCVNCPAGRVYMEVLQDCVCRAGFAFNDSTCQECAAGKFSASDGLAKCSSCPPGFYSAERGSTICSKCPLGNFSEDSGSPQCASCEDLFGKGMTTEVPGTSTRDECRCGVGTYQDAESRACLDCPAGMECPFGADMAPGSNVQPQLLPSFWSDSQEPLSVFRCQNSFRCPGHDFGSCGAHTKARSCSHCDEGWIWDSTQCVPCSYFARSGLLFPVLPLLLVPVIVCCLYGLFSDEYDQWGSWQNGLAAFVFILLNWAQILALMQSMELDMPEEAVRFFESLALANDLLRAFAPHCSRFSSFQALQAVGHIAPAVVLLLAFLCWLAAWGLSRLTGRGWLEMETDRTCNVAMSLIYTFFTSIVTGSCTLFKCGPNPNGTQSLVADRSIVCFGDEWLDLLAVEIVGILVWCFGVACLFSRAIFYSSVQHFHNKDVQRRWKFLFIKYRPDVHWWSLVFMARAVVLNLGIIVVQQSVSKLHFVIAVLMLYFALVSVFRPWRHRINNVIDGLTQLCLIAVASFLTRFALDFDRMDYVMSKFTLAAFTLIFVLSAILCCSMVLSQIWEESTANPQSKLRTDMICAFQTVYHAKDGEFKKFLEGLGEWDAAHMRAAKNIIMNEFCRVSSRPGVSQHDLSKRIADGNPAMHSSWRGTVDWNIVDANVGRFSTASYGSNDALPNRVAQASQLVQGVSRVGW